MSLIPSKKLMSLVINNFSPYYVLFSRSLGVFRCPKSLMGMNYELSVCAFVSQSKNHSQDQYSKSCPLH